MDAEVFTDHVSCNTQVQPMHDPLQHYEGIHAKSAFQMAEDVLPAQTAKIGRNMGLSGSTKVLKQPINGCTATESLQQAIWTGQGVSNRQSLFFSDGFSNPLPEFHSCNVSAVGYAVPGVLAQVSGQDGSGFESQASHLWWRSCVPIQANALNTVQDPCLSSKDMIRRGSSIITSTSTTFTAEQSLTRQTLAQEFVLINTPTAFDMHNSQLSVPRINQQAAKEGDSRLEKYVVISNDGSGVVSDSANRLSEEKARINNAFHNKPAPPSCKKVRANMGARHLPKGSCNREIRAFKRLVIGCEKAYGTRNALKYHEKRGHQDQLLEKNEDGSFSIIDPVTLKPYPGTFGMEKAKPYHCEVCSKRYKNRNGLTYHLQHNPACNLKYKSGEVTL